MNRAEAVAHLEAAMPPSRPRGYIAALVVRVPHDGNRAWMTKYVIHLHQTPTPFGLARAPSGIYRLLQGPIVYLEDLGDKAIEDATLEDFQGIWIQAIHAPARTPRQRRGPITPETRTEYQHQCRRFLAWALGEEHAKMHAAFLPQSVDDADPLTHIVAWEKLDELQGKLSGLNLALFILLTASGPIARDIRQLPVDAVRYDGPMCLVDCPPNVAFPAGRVVPLHHGDEVVAAYQAVIRRDNPQQRWLFPSRKNPDRCLNGKDLQGRVRAWGRRIGIPHLRAEDLRMTYLCYLLSRNDVGEHYVQHAMGVGALDRVKALKRAVDAALLAGHDFGQPGHKRRKPTPGHRPCTACGKLDNPVGVQHKVCSGCGTPFGNEPPTKATHILSDLADAVRRLREITGETRNDRAEAALAALEAQPHS